MSGRSLAALLREHWSLALVLVALVAVSIGLNITGQELERPDEPAFLADALDAVDAQDNPAYADFVDQFEDYAAPRKAVAYRALVRGVVRLVVDPDRDDADVRPNPYVQPYDPQGAGNKNALIYPLGPGQLATAVHVLRAISLVLMVATVLLVYHIGLWLANDRLAATLAAGIVALLPNTLIASASAGADALTAFAMAGYLATAVYVWRRPVGMWPAIVLGVVTGTATWLAPTLWLPALLAPLILIVWVKRQRRDCAAKSPWSCALLGLGAWSGAIIIGAWLFWPMSGSWTWLTEALSGLRSPGLSAILQRSVLGLWGLGGWRNILLDEVIYTSLGVLGILSVGGLGLAIIDARWNDRERQRPALWIVLFVGLLAALSVFWNLARSGGLITQGQTDLVIPAAILLAIGICEWSFRGARWVLSIAMICVLTFAAATLFPWRSDAALQQTIAWDTLDSEELDTVGIEYGSDLYLVGYAVDRDSVARGETLTVQLVWLARKRPSVDYTMSVEVTGRQRMQVGITNTMPGQGRSPTSSWLPGQIVIVEVPVSISEIAQTPTRGDLRVTVYTGAKEDALEARAPNGADLGISPRIGSVRLTQPYTALYEPAAPIRADLGRTIRLFGLNLSPIEPVLGQEMIIDLYWQALAPVSRDYTVFIHLVDGYGRILSQTDEPPLQGDYPTTFWRAGEQVRDTHAIAIPGTLGPGPYYLFVGMYDPETNERLTYTAGDGTTADHVTLGPLFSRTP